MDGNKHLELVRAAIRGDQTALTVLLTETYETLRTYLQRRIPPDLHATIDCDDLIQETHVVVFRRIGDFQAEDETALIRWIQTIAANRVRTAIRHRRAHKRGGTRRQVQSAGLQESISCLLNVIAAHDQTPSRAAARSEIAPAIAAALSVLAEASRQAVALVYLEGLPVADAAKKMNRTERAVHNLCYKARNHLRNVLGSRSDFLSQG